MTRQAPLTTRALGGTRCPYCEKRFTDTPALPVVEVEGQVENTGRVDSIGQRHRGIGTHAETRRWHADCLSEFEAANEAYWQQAAADRDAMVRSICEASGLDYDTVMAEHAARQEASDD